SPAILEMMRRWTLLIAVALGGCAGAGANLRAEGPAQRLEVRLAKAVEVRKESGQVVQTESLEVGDVFYASDWQVVAWVSLGEADRSHKVRWIWYDPSGERYVDSGELVANPGGGPKKFNHLWHTLRIWGEPAARRSGRWNVTVYVDGEPAAS